MAKSSSERIQGSPERVGVKVSLQSGQQNAAIVSALKSIARTVVLAAKIGGSAVLASACTEDDADVPLMPPAIGESVNGLTINDLHPPRAPMVLPLQNGVATRVSQKAEGDFSHNRDYTRHAVDFADETFEPEAGSESGLVLAPLSGVVRRVIGNCVDSDRQCCVNNRCCHPNKCGGCNGGWGQTVELTSRGGETYIFGHCDNFRNEAPDGTFVLRGTPLCEIGCTGNSSGPHSHADRVSGRDGNYTSLGVPSYITTRVGEAEPSLLTPDNFQTCCFSCATVPRRDGNHNLPPDNPACAEYISFNRSLKDTLHSFAEEIQRVDPRIELDGNVVPNVEASLQNSPVIWAYQNILFNRVQSVIHFYVSSPSGAGQRNPFIDVAYSWTRDPATRDWIWPQWHVQIHTPRFINFDLWDFANSSLSQQERDGLRDGNLPFTQNVQSYDMQQYDNWADWELYGAEFNVNGEQILALLAVYRPMRGGRYAKLLRDGQWSEWTLM